MTLLSLGYRPTPGSFWTQQPKKNIALKFENKPLSISLE
jgi:hypothetical protein